jgi:hypothetical protein
MIKTVLLFRNGMVAVCDDHDQQVVELQGHYSDVVELLRAQDLTRAEIFVAGEILPGGLAGDVQPDVFLNLEVKRSAGGESSSSTSSSC